MLNDFIPKKIIHRSFLRFIMQIVLMISMMKRKKWRAEFYRNPVSVYTGKYHFKVTLKRVLLDSCVTMYESFEWKSTTCIFFLY